MSFKKKCFQTAATALLALSSYGQDLVITGVATPEGELIPGETAEIVVTVSNPGDPNLDPSVPTGTGFKVAANIATLGLFTSASQNEEIPAGGTLDVTIKVPITQASGNGSYNIDTVTVDSASVYAETNEGNNVLSDAGILTVFALADLSITELKLSNGPYYPGSSISYTIAYENNGDRDAGAFQYKIFVEAPEGGTSFTLTGAAAAVASGGAGGATLVGVVPLNNPNGEYKVTLGIDSLNAVAESEEGNNEAESSFSISTQPNLQIIDLDYDSGEWEAGDPVNFSITYQNAPFFGSARTSRIEAIPENIYYIEVVLSKDAVFGNDDDFLIHRRGILGHPYAANRDYNPFGVVGDGDSNPTTSNLVPGDIVNYQWIQSMPANYSGDYFVLAKIDVDEAIEEYVEDDRNVRGDNVWFTLETARISINTSTLPDPTTERVSVKSDGTEGTDLSDEPSLSTDGRYIAFSSLAALDDSDTDTFYDVYLKDQYTGAVTLVTKSLGTVGFDGDNRFPVISGNGAYVAFQSDSETLDPSDSNRQTDIYVWEKSTGITRRVSRGIVSGLANSSSFSPSISEDGKVIVYSSRANNLVAGGTTANRSHVYAYNLDADSTTLLSLANGGGEANGDSFEPDISADGSFVAYASEATNIVAGVTDQQVYRINADGSGAVLVSQLLGTEGNDRSFHPSINGDGSVVAFASDATDLDGVLADTNGRPDVFIRDISAGTTTRVVASNGDQLSVPPSETPDTLGALQPSISDDGRYVVFKTQSDNLLPTSIERSDGVVFNLPAYGNDGYNPNVEDPESDVIVGYSDLSSLHPFTSRATSDIYLYDRDNPNATTLVSRNKFGYLANAYILADNEPTIPSSRNAVISGDGRFVAFAHDGRGNSGLDHTRTNRLSSDANGVRDVFVRDLRTLTSFELENPPTVSLASPLSGTNLSVGQPVLLTAVASDSNGYITQVEFFINGVTQGALSRGDFSSIWTPDQPGTFQIQVIVTDDDGIRTASNVSVVTVNNANAPTVSILTPADGDEYFSTESFSISASAFDTDGVVESVTFYQNGVALATDTDAPFGVSIAPQNPGVYHFLAVAKDNNGYSGFSSPVTITIKDGTAPVVSLTGPSSDLIIGESSELTATVSNSSVLIESVSFYINGVLAGEGVSQNGIWKTTFIPGSVGQVAIRVLATDNSGNVYSSGSTILNVVPGSAPVLQNILPVDGSILSVGNSYKLSVKASDADGTISSVFATINGEPGTSLTQATEVGVFEYNWIPSLLGTNTVVLTATDNVGNETSTTLTYTVITGAAPAVSFLSPIDGARYLPGTNLPVQVNAFDSDGLVASVSYYLNNVFISSAETAPYRTSISLPSVGVYSLKAIAVDNAGIVSNTAEITITAGLLDTVTPEVVINHPLPLGGGDTVNDVSVPSSMFINASALDPDGTIADVRFYINGQLIGSAENKVGDTYSIYFKPNAPGNYVIYADAIDNDGNVGQSIPIQLDVGPLESPLPLASVREPYPFTPVGEKIDILVDAEAGLLTVDRVDFYANGVLVGSTEESVSDNLFKFSWKPQITGNYDLTARVVQIDPGGNTWDNWTLTDSVPVTVTPPPSGNPPSVVFLYPFDGSSVTNVSRVILRAGAQDSDGTVSQVDFYLDNNLIGSDTTAPYTLDWVPGIIGQKQLLVVATDNDGNYAASETILIDVLSSGGTPPNVVLLDPNAIDINLDGIADAEIGLSSTQTVSVSMNNGEGLPTSVVVYVNGLFLGNATKGLQGNVWSIDWTPSSLGINRVDVVVRDSLGNEVNETMQYNVVDAGASSAPTVSFLSPLDGARYLPGTNLPVQVQAYDIDGIITAVNFYLNDALVDTITSAPYRTSISLPSSGNYKLKAVAQDNAGLSSVPQVITIIAGVQDTVTPEVVINHPLPLGGGDTVNDVSVPSSMFINAFVRDPDGAVDQVRFYINGQFIGNATNQVGDTYSIFFNPNAPGNYVIYADAVDVDGNIGQAIPIQLDVGPLESPLPVASIRQPYPFSPIGEEIDIFVDADAGLLAINRVDFYANGVLVGSTEEAVSDKLFKFTWSPSEPGNFNLTARVVQIDPGGNTWDNWTITNGVPVTVTQPSGGSAPSVVLTYPFDGDTVTNISALILRAGAQDADGLITKVDFYADNVLIGTDLTSPYSVNWVPGSIGEKALMAVATDNDGDYSASQTILLNVLPSAGELPEVNIVTPDATDGNNDGIADAIVDTFVNQEIGIQISDGDGNVSSVNVYLNGALLGEAEKASTTGLWTIPWTPFTEGMKRIDIVVKDSLGNEVDKTIRYQVKDSVSQMSVAITSPVDGAETTVLNPISIQASATNPVGTIKAVEFSVNGEIVGSSTQYPYTTSYTPLSVGTYELMAIAENNLGQKTASAPVALIVKKSQTVIVNIDTPTDGTSVQLGVPVLVTASAQSTGGGELALRFYANGTLIGQDTSFPYSAFWTPQSIGNFAIRVEAVELATNALASSDEINVTVTSTALPVVSFVSPGAISPTAGSDVLVEVHATDSDGSVESVQFYVNGVPVGLPDRSAPFATFWQPGSPGQYTLSALAIDDSGNQVVESKRVTVGPPVGIVPSVTLSVTASGNITPGSRVVVRANVFDDFPENVIVTFFMNGTQLGVADTEPPYSIIVDPAIGTFNSYSLTAVALDEDGNSRASELSPLYISDVPVDQPSVELISPSNGETLTQGSRAPIRVKVTGGAAASIKTVVFYADGVEIGRDATAPYSLDWIPDLLGNIKLTAATLLNSEVYDHDNDAETPFINVTPVNVAAPANVVINNKVGQLPSISLAVLPTNTNLAIGSKVVLYADAQDLDGTIQSVSFYKDGELLGADSEWPFVFTHTTTQEGEFFFNAVARDSDDNVVTSSYLNISVSSRVVPVTPVVNLTVPQSGQEGSIISLRASTQGFVTPANGVTFYVNGQSVGQSTEVPHVLPWLANLSGDLSFFSTAQSTLSDGSIVTSVSSVQKLTLTENLEPLIGTIDVSFTNKSGSKPNPLVGEAITFTIPVTDTGPISEVELLRDGEPVASTTTASTPYQLIDTPPGLGLYNYSVVVTDKGGLQAQSSNISVSVVLGAGPVVSVTNPLDGAQLSPNGSVRLRAAAVDSDGSVSEVQFLVNGEPYGAALTQAPYFIDFQPPLAGIYSISARARDNSGNVTESASVSMTVLSDNAPAFTLFSNDLNGTVARFNVPIHWFIGTADDYGVTSVVLYRNNSPVTSESNIPVEVVDTPPTAGTYTYFAEAIDTAGNVTQSDSITIEVTRGAAPSVQIVSPLNDTSVAVGANLIVRAQASRGTEPGGHPQGSLEQVEFFANNTSLGVVTDAPYFVEFSPQTEGAYNLTAVATTDTGLSTTSTIVQLDALSAIAPSLSLDILPGRENLVIGSKLLLYANANTQDSLAAVAEVRFYRDSILLGSDSTAPYSFTLPLTRAGTSYINAVAIDTNGDMVSSDYLSLSVSSKVVAITPNLTMTVPSSGQQGSLISLSAATQGFVNQPESVVFYVNGQMVGEAETAPYNFNWLASLSGNITFFSSASYAFTDGTFLTTVSDVQLRNFSENTAPAIQSVTTSFPGYNVNTKPNPFIGDNVTFQVAVLDSGPVDKVELFRNGEFVGLSNSSLTPYEVSDLPPGLGQYNYSVLVTDKGGLQTESSIIPVSVVMGTAPSVAVIFPTNGSSVAPGSNLRLVASATDSDGSVASVQFYINGQSVGSPITQVPYALDFQPNAPGTYKVRARAIDNSGNYTDSAEVSVTVLSDNPPVVTSFTNDLGGTMARLNKPIRWTIATSDDFGVSSVVLYRNSVALPSGTAVPVEVIDTPPATGIFTYVVEVRDTGGNIATSAPVTIEVTRGALPVVNIVSPVTNTDVAIGNTVTIRAQAVPGQETGGAPAGSVTQVQFFRNGTNIGTVAASPYLVEFTPTAETAYLITAVATSDTGLTAVSSELIIHGIDGNVPEIVTFTNDTTGDRSPVTIPITFTVEATDNRGIDSVKIYQNGTSLGEALGNPKQLTITPDFAGNYTYFAEATNIDGKKVRSESVTILVEALDPEHENRDFVYQVFLDLLFRAPTSEELITYVSALDTAQTTKRRLVSDIIDPYNNFNSGEYDYVRSAILTHWFVFNEWPTRSEIESYLLTIKQAGLAALIQDLMPHLQARYVSEINADPTVSLSQPVVVVPLPSSEKKQIEYFISYLFKLKYGLKITSQQLSSAVLEFQTSISRENFIRDFIRDVRIDAVNDGFWSLFFFFNGSNPPNQAYLNNADAASLYINLLRVDPTQAEVEQLSQLLFANQVQQILDDPRFENRFINTFPTLVHYSDGWKFSSWFGWFNTSSSMWSFHTELGWIALKTTGQKESSIWFYDNAMGWVWTNPELYPYVYERNSGHWLMSGRYPYISGKQRWFYDFQADIWMLR